MSRRRVLEPTGAREHVRGPDVIPTATVKGAREGARVGIMSVGARELRVGRPSRDKTRIPLMSVSGFNNLQSHPGPGSSTEIWCGLVGNMIEYALLRTTGESAMEMKLA